MNLQWIIIVGSLSDGIQTVHGPFEDKDHANQWASIYVGKQQHTITSLAKV